MFKEEDFFPLIRRLSNSDADILSFVGGLLGGSNMTTHEFES